MLDSRIRTLLTVAETGSLTKTAEKLKLTQPAVSHQIMQLENELGVAIFIRRKSGMELTQEGQIVVDYAYRMYQMYFNMKKDIHDRQIQKKRYAIGMETSLNNALLEQVLVEYPTDHPGCFIALSSESIRNLYRMLDDHEVNCLLVGHVPELSDVSSVILDTDNLVCVMSPSHPLAKKSMISTEDLKREKIILPSPRPGNEERLQKVIEPLGLTADQFNIVLETDNYSTIKRMVRQNRIVSILPESSCRFETQVGTLTTRPLENIVVSYPTVLVYPKGLDDMTFINDFVAKYNELKGQSKNH